MPTVITRFSPEHRTSVREFNWRIAQGGWGEFHLEDLVDQPSSESRGFSDWEAWLAIQDGVVRGCYRLKDEQFSFSGNPHPVAFYNLSLSEAVIDRRYAAISVKMATTAMTQRPLLFALGMGGQGRPLPQLLKALRWHLLDVPFYFRAIRPRRVFRNLLSLRKSFKKSFVMDLAAFTGIATLSVLLWQKARQTKIPQINAKVEEVEEFGEWADEIWRRCGPEYTMIACRNRDTLNAMYPKTFPRLKRLAILESGKVIGWAVVQQTQMQKDRHFGNLFVGTLVDCLAPKRHSSLLVSMATGFLETLGVDLIISNQSHEDWCSALTRSGYLKGPSNFVFAASPQLGELLKPFAEQCKRAHINRGDGDGPIHI